MGTLNNTLPNSPNNKSTLVKSKGKILNGDIQSSLSSKNSGNFIKANDPLLSKLK